MSDVKSKIMLAEDVLSMNDGEYVEIQGFKPGQTLRIRSLAAGDFLDWVEQREAGPDAKRLSSLRLIVKSVCDENGDLIFNDAHIEQLKKIRYKVIESIVDEISKLNELFGRKADQPKKG
jgi:hypothetical protein